MGKSSQDAKQRFLHAWIAIIFFFFWSKNIPSVVETFYLPISLRSLHPHSPSDRGVVTSTTQKKTRVLKKMPVSMQPIIFANHSDTRFCMPSPESFCYSFHMIDNDHDSHYWNDYSLFRFGRSYKRWWFIVVFSMTWIRRNAKNWRPVGLEWIWSPY